VISWRWNGVTSLEAKPMSTERLLCATDGSHRRKRPWLRSVACSQLDLPITFLVVASGEDDAQPLVWDEDRVQAGDLPHDRELLLALKWALDAGRRHVRLVRAFGNAAAPAIVGYAERNAYHHIIVGSEGRAGAKRMLLGSVAQDIVQRAHCPVTVVR
jgi:nucleotide-binding universal stress UspA family protein